MNRTLLIIAGTILLLCGCSLAAPATPDHAQPEASIRRVAVIVNPTDYAALIGEAIQQNTLSSSIESQFINRLLQKRFQVISRSRVRALYEEIAFQRSPHTTGVGVAELGRLLNVSHVFVVEGLGSIGATVQTQYSNMILCGLTMGLAQQHREARAVARRACRAPTVEPAMAANLHLDYQLIEVTSGRILASSSAEVDKTVKNSLEMRSLAESAVNKLRIPGREILK